MKSKPANVSELRVNIIAIDPGVTTGLAVIQGNWNPHLDDFLRTGLVCSRHLKADTGPQSEYLVASELNKQVAHSLSFSDDLVVIYEDFVLYGGTHSSSPEGLSAVRITSQFLAVLHERGLAEKVRLFPQMASEAKTDTNEKLLRRVEHKGLKQKLLRPHGKDAFWHAATWVRRNHDVLDYKLDKLNPGAAKEARASMWLA